jgi:flagellar hook-length control protein FliK
VALKSVSPFPAASTAAARSPRSSSGGIAALLGRNPTNADSSSGAASAARAAASVSARQSNTPAGSNRSGSSNGASSPNGSGGTDTASGAGNPNSARSSDSAAGTGGGSDRAGGAGGAGDSSASGRSNNAGNSSGAGGSNGPGSSNAAAGSNTARNSSRGGSGGADSSGEDGAAAAGSAGGDSGPGASRSGGASTASRPSNSPTGRGTSTAAGTGPGGNTAAPNGTLGPGTSAGSGGSAAPAASAPSFLQMLAQANANSASPDGKASAAPPGNASDAKSTTADTKSDADIEATGTDPNAIAAALALLSQYMASPPASRANVGAQPSSASAATQTSGTVASLNGVDGAPAAATTPGTSSATGAETNTEARTEQPLAALLVGAGDPGTDTAKRASDSTQSDGSASRSASAPADASGAPGSALAGALNPAVSLASHFGTQLVPAHRSDLRSPVGTSAWADELGGKVTWMARQGLESASLKLSPEHLGPVEVHISVENGATSVIFGAAQADTRAALEQALPRLREMFAGQGLTLADAGVSREPPRQQNRPAPVGAISGVSPVSEETTSVSATTAVRLGLLDTYA